jgi:ATP synthase F1 delta subunit
VHADVDSIAALVKDNQKLRELLYNPVVEDAKKKAVVAKITKEAGFQKYTSNFLNLLVEKDRMNLLSEICESFEEQYCDLTDTQVRYAGSANRQAALTERISSSSQRHVSRRAAGMGDHSTHQALDNVTELEYLPS